MPPTDWWQIHIPYFFHIDSCSLSNLVFNPGDFVNVDSSCEEILFLEESLFWRDADRS
jgi:hypothetical protein